MWWLALAGVGTSLAQSDVEVVVYDDLFARWEDTRWIVEAELITPMGTWFADDRNRGITSYAFQVRSVLGCGKDAKLSKKKLEVSCTIEDIALQVTTYRHSGSPAAREVAQEVLTTIDAMLTGASVQLQVDAKGGINNVDIEGLTASNERERLAREGLRQVVMRVIAGYHLRIPDQAQRTGQVLEHNSELMAVPSLTGTLGSTVMVHSVSPWNEYNLVQTLGEGTVTASVPAPRQEQMRVMGEDTDPFANPSVKTGGRATLADSIGSNTLAVPGGGRALPSAPPPNELGQPLPRAKNSDGDVLDLTLSYALTASGVALFERSSGILTERVWTVDGTPTASSGDGLKSVPFRNIGRLRLLGKDEKPDLGPTHQVAIPGVASPDLPPWAPLQSERIP